MILAKSQKDLDKMREVGELIAEVREALRGMVEPGITTLELNEVAEKMMLEPRRETGISRLSTARYDTVPVCHLRFAQ